ncbi:hypothetical protein [Lachnospira multipara]|uniref:hypothetical protein n=1 Tax=Lachnospira multipara TaxID=28051 RepID=UPI00047FB9A7|nr:hypothetical protein [Lachnospira multipara]
MKNSSLKMKRVVGMILAFLMVFNLVVFTGQVGAFADGNTPGESSSNDVGQSNQNTSGESTSDGSIKVNILTSFTEITSVGEISGKTEIAMIPQKYGTNDVILGLPDGSALVRPIALASDTKTLNSIPETEVKNLVAPYNTASKSDITNAVGEYCCIDYNNKDSVFVVQPSKGGKGFDHCPYGTIKYNANNAWYYNCCRGGVHGAGPFYIYTYTTKQIEYSSDNVEVKFKEDFTPLMSAGTVDPSLLEAVINLDSDTTYTVPSIELSDNYVNPETGDVTITAKVGVDGSYIEKEITAAVKIEESSIYTRLNSGIYTGVQAKTFSKNEFEVGFILDGKSYTASDFELVDATVDPSKGDTQITIKYAGYTKQIDAATKLEESAVFARLKSGKYTGVQAKTFSKDDIEVGFNLDGKSYTASDFELVDATVNPINGDTKITIKYAGYTKEISAATAITGDVKANGTTGVKELINKVSTITPKTNSVINNNSISTVEAAINIMEPTKLDKYVNEAINLGDANVAVKQDGTAAKLQAKVNTVDASVITNSLTPEEIIRVLAGEKVDLRLEVVVDETSDAKDTTGGQLIESNLNTNESAYYFTADLYKIFNDDEENKSSITEFSDAISFTIDIPEEIRNEGRLFTLVASHELADGTFETFELVDTDDDDTTFTASTTKLCTMALVYADEAVAETPIVEDPVIEPAYNYDVSPETADLRNILWAFIITVSAGAVLVVTFRKEFQ